MVAEVAILRSLERRVMADREHAWPSNALALLRGGCGSLRHYMTSPRIHLGRGGTVNGFQTLDIATLAGEAIGAVDGCCGLIVAGWLVRQSVLWVGCCGLG